MEGGSKPEVLHENRNTIQSLLLTFPVRIRHGVPVILRCYLSSHGSGLRQIVFAKKETKQVMTKNFFPMSKSKFNIGV